MVVGVSEELDEPLDAGVPEAFVAPEPVIGTLELARVDAAVVDASAHRPLHESGPLEGLDVLGRGGQRHPVGCGELADGQLTAGEPFEHRSARVIAEGSEDEVEVVMTLNHVVEYTAPGAIVNRLVEHAGAIGRRRGAPTDCRGGLGGRRDALRQHGPVPSFCVTIPEEEDTWSSTTSNPGRAVAPS